MQASGEENFGDEGTWVFADNQLTLTLSEGDYSVFILADGELITEQQDVGLMIFGRERVDEQ